MTVSLPPELAEQVDRLAATEHRTRSEVFREAFRRYLASQEGAGDVIGTRDKDLLTLSSHGSTRILKPADFLAELRGKR